MIGVWNRGDLLRSRPPTVWACLAIVHKVLNSHRGATRGDPPPRLTRAARATFPAEPCHAVTWRIVTCIRELLTAVIPSGTISSAQINFTIIVRPTIAVIIEIRVSNYELASPRAGGGVIIAAIL